MEETVESSKRIVAKLVKKSFPLLKGRKINIFESKRPKGTADTRSWPGWSRIRLSPDTKSLTEEQLIGVLAHELCYIEWYCEVGFLRYLWFMEVIAKTSREAIKADERATDMKAIDKGYGAQLYAHRVLRYKNRGPRFEERKDLYLSPEEIVEHMKSKDMTIDFELDHLTLLS